MAKKFIVTGDDRDVINRRFEDVMRQLRLKNGSPLDPELVKIALQRIGEGNFDGISKKPIRYFSDVIYRNNIKDMSENSKFEVDFYFRTDNEKIIFSFIEPKFVKLFGSKIEKGNLSTSGFNYRTVYARNLLQVCAIQTISRELGSADVIFTINNIYEIIKNHRLGNGKYYLNDGKNNYFLALDINSKLQLLSFWWNEGWCIKVFSDFESNKEVLPPARFFSFRS